jgi:hypothetical protein
MKVKDSFAIGDSRLGTNGVASPATLSSSLLRGCGPILRAGWKESQFLSNNTQIIPQGLFN